MTKDRELELLERITSLEQIIKVKERNQNNFRG
jgi:hypothetical protein